jgi:hypothetical protein
MGRMWVVEERRRELRRRVGTDEVFGVGMCCGSWCNRGNVVFSHIES